MDEVQLKPAIAKSFTDIHLSYTLEQPPLGTGQYSSVHRAVCRKDGPVLKCNTPVAVKVYVKGRRGIEHAIRAEMDVLTLMQTPEPCDHIMKFIEIQEDEQRFYVVLELVGGGDLFHRISSSHHFSERMASDMFRSLLEAVDRMHAKGVIHRDIKPQNIMFSDSEGTCLKLVDFSSAYIIKKDTPVSKAVGTVKFMAPEMLQKKEYNAQVDMWAIGVSLYIVLSGTEPFKGSGFALHQVICDGKFSFPESNWAGVSSAAKDLVSKLLTLQPSKRITSAKALTHPWLQPNNAEGAEIFRNLSDMKLSSSMKASREIAIRLKQEEEDSKRRNDRSSSSSRSAATTACIACGRHVLGGVEFLGGYYHEQCFTCTACSLPIIPLSNLKVYERFPYHNGCLQKMISQQPLQFRRLSNQDQGTKVSEEHLLRPQRRSHPSVHFPEESYQPSIGEKEGPIPSMPIAVSRTDDKKQGGAFKSKFCYECGTKFQTPTMKFCGQCGEQRM